MWGDNTEARKELIGQKIESLWVSEGEAALYLKTEKGVYWMDTEADCCSETWWADAIGVSALIGGLHGDHFYLVKSIENIDMPQPDDVNQRTRQEYDFVYGIKVKTGAGVCDLIYRNSSNGYYGGYSEEKFVLDGEIPDGAVQITKDWSA